MQRAGGHPCFQLLAQLLPHQPLALGWKTGGWGGGAEGSQPGGGCLMVLIPQAQGGEVAGRVGGCGLMPGSAGG